MTKNELASQSILYIYADGPKGSKDDKYLNQIKETRTVIRNKQWCKEVIIKEQVVNLGLADSIINGVTEVLKTSAYAIVLEDDIITSSYFLTYMNTALNLYRNDERVMHVSGYQYPIKSPEDLPSTFFVNIPTCWGWGTWDRAWKYFNNDTGYLINELHKFKLLRRFNLDDHYDYFCQLDQNEKGVLKTWAVKWYASFFLQHGFSLHPNHSLTKNIGLDNSGQNGGDTSQKYGNQKIIEEVKVDRIKLKESNIGRKQISLFLKSNVGKYNVDFLSKIKAAIKRNLPVSILLNLQNPVSRKFGFDRGLPIDRFYIEDFLSANSSKISGTVLEISEPTYTNMFGNGVVKSVALHYSGEHSKATLIGDLTEYEGLPKDFADCFICTQTLNFIYDFKKAINGIYHIVKNGGTALVTVAGICQVSQYDANRWGDFWRFNPQGIKRAFEEVFGEENIVIKSYGNSYAAAALLKGIAANEIKRNKLTFFDQDYPVVITIIATKNA
ncbi:MAG: hypothetical protein ABIN01_08935 [Ferruginibacter sp.]